MRMEFDYIDGVLLGLVFLGASVMVGIGSFDLFNIGFTDQVANIGGGITLATVAVVGGYAGTILTNDNTDLGSLTEDVQDLEQSYYTVVNGVVS